MKENVENDSELLVPAPTRMPLKNTDKSMYLCGENGQFCPFCQKHYKRLVNHFKRDHPNSEVFCSRISPKMIEDTTNGKNVFTKFFKGTAQYLRAICIFCEEQKEFTPYYWIDHIRSHTGEYGNRCMVCSELCCFYTHCGMSTTRIHPFNLSKRAFEGFRCLDCNYVQIDEENMKNHLYNEHGFTDIENTYEEFEFIPALDNLQLQPDDVLFSGIFDFFIQPYSDFERISNVLFLPQFNFIRIHPKRLNHRYIFRQPAVFVYWKIL